MADFTVDNNGKFFNSKGKEVGFIRDGYKFVSRDGKQVRAHRLAWYLHYGEWPNGHLDHINGNKSDNRIENLRIATPSQNAANTGPYSRNKLGLKGISLENNMYRVRLQKDGKNYEIGRYTQKEHAIIARQAAATALFGQYAWLNDQISRA